MGVTCDLTWTANEWANTDLNDPPGEPNGHRATRSTCHISYKQTGARHPEEACEVSSIYSHQNMRRAKCVRLQTPRRSVRLSAELWMFSPAASGTSDSLISFVLRTAGAGCQGTHRKHTHANADCISRYEGNDWQLTPWNQASEVRWKSKPHALHTETLQSSVSTTL